MMVAPTLPQGVVQFVMAHRSLAECSQQASEWVIKGCSWQPQSHLFMGSSVGAQSSQSLQASKGWNNLGCHSEVDGLNRKFLAAQSFG